MTYDSWKLETPEDEADRKRGYYRRHWSSYSHACHECGFRLDGQDIDDVEWECVHCGAWNTVDEPDPDDRREDEAEERRLNR
jgi:hypothetical protein